MKEYISSTIQEEKKEEKERMKEQISSTIQDEKWREEKERRMKRLKSSGHIHCYKRFRAQKMPQNWKESSEVDIFIVRKDLEHRKCLKTGRKVE